MIVKLFIHEIRRVFADRMLQEDYVWFKGVVTEAYKRFFSNPGLLTDETFNCLFTDVMKLDGGVSVYEEVVDRRKLVKILENKQEDYNFSSNDKLNLVFFDDAIEQILRICRILRQPRGNAMLIGVGGSGKQSLSKLASFIMKCEPYQIEIDKKYNSESFRGDLQKIAKITGCQRKQLSFIFTDVQIAYESFLEDINNILNTGEVPNLFTKK
jgi:dynein heavy chain